jgi:hypothetical protein
MYIYYSLLLNQSNVDRELDIDHIRKTYSVVVVS